MAEVAYLGVVQELPGFAEAHMNRGLLYHDLSRLDIYRNFLSDGVREKGRKQPKRPKWGSNEVDWEIDEKPEGRDYVTGVGAEARRCPGTGGEEKTDTRILEAN